MDKSNKNVIPAVVLAVPVLLWVAVICYYSINLPWYDDFDPFPDFLNKWIGEASFSERLRLLFQPNNEHRMVIGKLVTVIYYKVTGQLNFTFLHLAGACFTLGTLALFWSAFKKSRLNPWYFLPVPFLLFQLQYHLIFLWAICSLQHQPVVFFVCLSMFLLAGKRFTGASLAGICATFAMSSGIFVWPAGVMILLLLSEYKKLIIWLVVGAVAVALYFYGMSAQGNESSFAFFVKNPHLSVLGFFAFLGGLFDFFPEKGIVVRSALPIIMSFLTMIWVVIWLFRQIRPWVALTFGRKINAFQTQAGHPAKDAGQLQSFLLGILTFLLVEALVIGLLRPRFGFFVMIVSNYKIYPALFLIVAYLSLLTSVAGERMRKRVWRGASAIAGLIWLISIFTYLPVIAERHKYYVVNGYNQEHNGFGLGHVPYSKGAAYVDDLMKGLVRQGVFHYPQEGNRLAKKVRALSGAVPKEREITVERRDSLLYINNPRGGLSPWRKNGEYAFVRNAERLYFFKMEPHKYNGRNFLRQYDKGSDTVIPYHSLLPGIYEVGWTSVTGENLDGGILEKVTIP